MCYEEVETWEHTEVQSGLEELNECGQRGLCITKRKGSQIWEPVYWFLSTEMRSIFFLFSFFFLFLFKKKKTLGKEKGILILKCL